MNSSPKSEPNPNHRFVTPAEAVVENFDGRVNQWLCRPDIVAAEKLQLCRASLPPRQGHDFHRHPDLEEIIYVIEGEVEQWVESSRRRLRPGDCAHIPTDIVHATFNVGSGQATILAILSPAAPSGPFLIDVSQEEPWASLRCPV